MNRCAVSVICLSFADPHANSSTRETAPAAQHEWLGRELADTAHRRLDWSNVKKPGPNAHPLARFQYERWVHEQLKDWHPADEKRTRTVFFDGELRTRRAKLGLFVEAVTQVVYEPRHDGVKVLDVEVLQEDE